MSDSGINTNEDFNTFLRSYKSTLKSVFYQRDNIETFVQKRGFPALVLRDIMAKKPLSVAIPSQYGGRGGYVKECLSLLEASSYESLPLSLTFGINIALFLEPVAKYGQDSIKEEIFNRFLTKQNMGGLMITEPDYGSDALNMRTTNVKSGSYYHINGVKHWQGLTGMADYWIMTCRNQRESGDLGRDIDLFVSDEHQKDQAIVVEEYFNNLGLYPIPYGKNIVDIKVPEEYKLVPESTGIKMLMDMLHRSRYQFAGMGMGFIQRMLDEALDQCTKRLVGGKPLLALDQVKFQISKIQNAFTICSGMCHRSADYSGIERNLALDIVEANSIKAYVTDLMQESAQTLTQLCGANGYKMENVGARGIVDSRPFQIFEGSNEMLYTQIGEGVLKMAKRAKIKNLFEFLSGYGLTENSVGYFKAIVDFEIETGMPQRKIIDLGKMISRIVCVNHAIELGNNGFRSDLVNNSIEMVRHELYSLINSYNNHNLVAPIIDYNSGSSWLQYS